jgi:hypothetical protein
MTTMNTDTSTIILAGDVVAGFIAAPVFGWL